MTSGAPLLVGWREWVEMPDLGLPAIKAKIDTGARTSCLHAFSVEPFLRKGVRHVRFKLHPVQRKKYIVSECTAKVVDRRHITDSGGHRELRYVILTRLHIGEVEWETEMTLANRETMTFRMLLGRKALEGRALIDASLSFVNGKVTPAQLRELYAS
jgi:hypothetical protein